MVSESVKQSISQDLVNGLPVSEISSRYEGVSKTTIYNIKKKLKNSTTKIVSHDLELRTAKRQLLEQRKRYRNALDKMAELEKELALHQHLSKLSEIVIPENWEILQKNNKEVVAFTLSSDWHIDEEVISEEIGGVNSYNEAIGRKRIEAYFKYVLRLLNMCRTESVIKRLVVGALGDAISGWIHEEFIETNTMTPPEAVIVAFELYVSGLDFLLREGDLDEIDVICCCGNHSRITKKPQVKRSYKKSYEWLMYQFLAKWYAMKGEKRIKFKLPTGYFNWLTVFGKDIRFHHGNRIQYRGGVGGIHIPLRKAIAQWNKARHADLDILGHWHSRETSRDYVINGSVVGYNEFAEFIKADFGPPEQAFFVIHPKYGKTAEFPIVLSGE